MDGRQLLIEEVDIQLVENAVLTESSGDKKYVITGPFMEADIQHRNKRVYPHQILQPQVESYQADISNSRAVGELNHPSTMEINPENIAIKIESLSWKDKHTVIGEAKVLTTPKGLILRSLMDEGIKFGVSSRGSGTLKEGVVQNDYRYVCNDVVWEPSARSAMVENIMESSTEWVFENGVLLEKQLEEVQGDLAKSAKPEDIEAAFKKIMEAVSKNFLHNNYK